MPGAAAVRSSGGAELPQTNGDPRNLLCALGSFEHELLRGIHVEVLAQWLPVDLEEHPCCSTELQVQRWYETKVPNPVPTGPCLAQARGTSATASSDCPNGGGTSFSVASVIGTT